MLVRNTNKRGRFQQQILHFNMNEKYVGTTVNERLYVSGYSNEFCAAVFEKNCIKAKEILRKIEFSDETIYPILESLGLLTDGSCQDK